MLTNHKIKSITLVLENSTNPSAVTVTTTDNATYAAAATAVSSTIEIDSVALASTELTALKTMVDTLVAAHEGYVGL